MWNKSLKSSWNQVCQIYYLFTLDKKRVAGLAVSKGLFSKKFKYKILRGNKTIADGLTISSLKFHKDEVNEIKKGQDCGLSFFEYQEFKEGDIIEAYEIKVLENNWAVFHVYIECMI